MHKSAKSIAEIIQKEKEFERIRKKVNEIDIVEGFEKIFPEIKTIAKAVRMEKDILFLRVENSVWRSELNLKQSAMIRKINTHFGSNAVKTIKFI